MNIAIGSDHGGVELKAALVGALAGAAKMIDMGPADKTSCDYPDYAAAVAKAVASGEEHDNVLHDGHALRSPERTLGGRREC